MAETTPIKSVMVTGATGFVGRAVVRELLSRGLAPVCLVRSAERLYRQHPDVDADRLVPVLGTLGDRAALQQAADLSQAVIHLVGIIIQRRLEGRSFRGLHVLGTHRVMTATARAGIERYVHMSALGTREGAVSLYHKTKWEAEQAVKASGLDWTIFRPSLIHGPQGEFMQLMKRFVSGWLPPMIPYFGSGTAKLQPVHVKDVAYCMVQSLLTEETVAQTIRLGGPRTYSWVELYEICRRLIPGAKKWKPMVSQPVALAKALAVLSGPPLALAELVVPSVGLFRFDTGQVDMSQEDSVCDHTVAEGLFNISMRSFEEELTAYAGLIR